MRESSLCSKLHVAGMVKDMDGGIDPATFEGTINFKLGNTKYRLLVPDDFNKDSPDKRIVIEERI